MRMSYIFRFCRRVVVKCIVLLRSLLGHIRSKARVRFEIVSLENFESLRLLFYQRRNLWVRTVYSQFVGRSQNRNLRILHLEVTQGPGIGCCKFSAM